MNVNVKVRYNDDDGQLWCTVHFLGLVYVLAPEEESTKYKREEKLLKKGKQLNWEDEVSLEGIYKEKGVTGFVETLKVTCQNTWSLLVNFLKRATIKNLEVKLNIVGEDAADTAIIYGWANSIVYPIVGAILDNVKEYKDCDIAITPDYSEGADSSVKADAKASIKLLQLILMLAESGVEAENLLLVLSKNPKHEKENVK